MRLPSLMVAHPTSIGQIMVETTEGRDAELSWRKVESCSVSRGDGDRSGTVPRLVLAAELVEELIAVDRAADVQRVRCPLLDGFPSRACAWMPRGTPTNARRPPNHDQLPR